jgi:hypothetical protein
MDFDNARPAGTISPLQATVLGEVARREILLARTV